MRTDWIEVGYKELVEKVSTVKNKLKQKDYSDSGKFPVVDQGKELIGGYTDSEDLVLNCNLPVIVFGDHTKAVKLINFRFVPGADGTKVLIPKPGINPTFLAFNTKILTQKIEDKGYARHYQQVENKTLFLPPLSEQRAIVARIEELFCELDHAVSSLKSAQAKLDIYRQAVLKKAFEGDENFESLTVEECCTNIVDCLHSTAKFKPTGFYCIDTTCIEDSRISFQKARFVDEETYLDRIRRLKPIENDILFSREGTVGKAVIVPPKIDLCLGQRMMMFRLKNGILPKFFQSYVLSPGFKAQYKPLIGGTTSPHLNIRDIRKLIIPVFSTEVQTQIVQEIESRLSVADKMAESIQTSLEKAEALRQSILKKAFEGRLLSEAEVEACRKEANWEPAERLLERIKSEKKKK